jgi:site-specific recombinase XerD
MEIRIRIVRNLGARNFNLGNRNMVLALKNALVEKGLSHSTIASYTTHCKKFVEFLQAEHGIKTLNQIERSHVQAYAEHLNERHENGELERASPSTMLSAVNTAMKTARQDSKLSINPVREAGLPSRTHIATVDRSASQSDHDDAKSAISTRLAAQLDLQREIGLRFKESSLINARKTLQEAETTGKIKICTGTKGGRDRFVPITSRSQIDALRKAANIQGSEKSLVPEHQTWAQYQNQSYREITVTKIDGFHSERHHYANNRYESIMGVKSPVQAGVEHKQHHTHIAKQMGISLQEAKQLDFRARILVSHELGHSRISITNNYLG